MHIGKGLPLMDQKLQRKLQDAELAAKLKGSLLLFIQALSLSVGH
jgi:hypothetical protein